MEIKEMPDTPEFPEYAITYSKESKNLRDILPDSLRPILDDIADRLAENPNEYPSRITMLSQTENIFVYTHPKPNLVVTYKIDLQTKIIYFLHIVAPTMEVSKSLFISYSHEDEEWLLMLKKWLATLEQRNLIKIWDDRDLKSGDNWREEIKKQLASAKVAVLLISPDFLASDFIKNQELPKLLDAAENEDLKIFWIPVSESSVDDTDIAKYQSVINEPLDTFKDKAELNKQFKSIYNRIKEVVES